MNDEQFQAFSASLSALGRQLTHLSAQQLVLQHAVYEILKVLPEKKSISNRVRDAVREELDETSDEPDQDAESVLTLALAALQEAAGNPPRR